MNATTAGLEVRTIPVTEFFQNARILIATDTKQAVIVDPGGDIDRILELIRNEKLDCSTVWLTHSHLDHAAGVAALRREMPFTLYGHPIEAQMRARIPEVAALYGLDPRVYESCPEPDVMLTGGEKLELGSSSFDVRFTPGHSPGHLVFYCESSKLLVAGDTIFESSIGRTDLPGGNSDTLIRSIREQILTLPDDTRVLPGHGSDTTVGKERKTNPYIR